MAVYKVIQDIEAQDKLVGPLTLKAFIYAAIAGLLGFINVRIFMVGGLGPARWVLILILLLPMATFAILALPIGKEQPTETWILSRLKFFLKPRVRVWDQSGVIELVTITVPKRIERQLTKGLSQGEVQSRLKALAMTLDSRGWAVKNVAVNLTPSVGYGHLADSDSDRLVAPAAMQQNAPVIDIHASDDIMDENNNATAKHFDELVKKSDTDRKSALKEIVSGPAEKTSGVGKDEEVDFQFMFEDSGGPDGKKYNPTVIRPELNKHPNDPDEDTYFQKRLGKARTKFHAEHPGKESKKQKHQKNEAVKSQPKTAKEQRSTAEDRADKLELAQSGNDLKVSSVAKLANRKDPKITQISPQEVEIDLH